MCDPGPETELRRAAVRISDSRGLLLDAKWDTALVVAGCFQFDAPKVTVSGCWRLDRDAWGHMRQFTLWQGGAVFAGHFVISWWGKRGHETHSQRDILVVWAENAARFHYAMLPIMVSGIICDLWNYICVLFNIFDLINLEVGPVAFYFEFHHHYCTSWRPKCSQIWFKSMFGLMIFSGFEQIRTSFSK